MTAFLTGDARFFWPENIKFFSHFPLAWDSSLNTGIGHSQIGSLWIITYFNLTLLFSKLGITWNLISLLFWILPSIILSFFSALFLFNHLFKDRIRYSLLSGIVYAFNTYFLMILTGGQLGICLAYSLAPLVLLRFIKIIENSSLRNVLITGLVLGLQLIFDPRIVYVSLAVAFLYMFFNFPKLKTIRKKIFFSVPFFISILLNAFWILPLLLTKSSPIPEGFNSIKGFEFFSFSDFSHALSLLHPNWPENIFGKVYFLQPEFLVLPILAYSSLLFVYSNVKAQNFNINILFFALLGLFGAFLAKGANPPFGEVNVWLFQYFPGMVMFRDPTKWYMLIALSYSMLIPHGLFNIASWINSKFKIQSLFLLLIAFYLLFLIRPLWFGELKEKFKPREVPKEYVALKDFLVSKPEFFRTLWIPQWQRYGFFSNTHPAIGREEIFRGNAEEQIDQLKEANTEKVLRDLSVKYIIVPYDSEGEIFLDDRKYSEKQYKEAVSDLRKVTWLRELPHLGKIHVFELANSKDHFWTPSATLKINYGYIKPTEYKIQVRNAKEGDLLIFSERFDRNWLAQNSGERLRSSKYKDLNSFRLPKDGDYELRAYYEPQSLVNLGLVISIGSLIAAITTLVGQKVKKMVKSSL